MCSIEVSVFENKRKTMERFSFNAWIWWKFLFSGSQLVVLEMHWNRISPLFIFISKSRDTNSTYAMALLLWYLSFLEKNMLLTNDKLCFCENQNCVNKRIFLQRTMHLRRCKLMLHPARKFDFNVAPHTKILFLYIHFFTKS